MTKEFNAAYSAHLLKKYGYIMSDPDLKIIKDNSDHKLLVKAILDRGGPFTAGDVAIFNEAQAVPDQFEDDVLDKYAEFIYNYAYNYKPEAQQMDSSIDPNEEHIGPMADDIEKVNPACIKEIPIGVKHGTNGDPEDIETRKAVDTGRLALMNAGAIAALAREVKELKSERT